jgi:hypothetical protein
MLWQSNHTEKTNEHPTEMATSKASASKDQATTAAKYPPSNESGCSKQQSIYQRWDQRDNNGKASATDSNDGQASVREGTKVPTVAKHPHMGTTITLLAAKHLLERRPATMATKHPPEKPI